MTPGFPTPETACPVLTRVGRAQFFDEIVPAGRPVVMRGLVGDWPAVRAARQSPRRWSTTSAPSIRAGPCG